MTNAVVDDWQQHYSVGHVLLDEQHKMFFVLCRKAAEVRTDLTPEGRERFHDLLNELVNYARRHFALEEQLLQQCAFPHFELHRAQHEAYFEKLTDFVLQATFGDLDRDGVFNYLTSWWSDHILNSDMKYRGFLHDPS